MALLADLGYLSFSFAHCELCAHRQGVEHDSLSENIFCEITGLQVKVQHCLNLGYALGSKQAHLSVPVSGMGITFNAVILNQGGLTDIMLLLALFLAYADSLDSAVGEMKLCTVS